VNLFFDEDGLGGKAQVQIAQFSNQAMLTDANMTVSKSVRINQSTLSNVKNIEISS
jgi:hypothetical protein